MDICIFLIYIYIIIVHMPNAVPLERGGIPGGSPSEDILLY